jgi:hypothetical protein
MNDDQQENVSTDNQEDEGPEGPVKPGTISFNFAAVPDELGQWDITFRWDDEVNPYATFTLSFGAGQNIGGDPPIDGWISWVEEELLLAFNDPSGPSHDAVRVPKGAPISRDEDEAALRDPERWLALARRIVRSYMRVDD